MEPEDDETLTKAAQNNNGSLSVLGDQIMGKFRSNGGETELGPPGNILR